MFNRDIARNLPECGFASAASDSIITFLLSRFVPLSEQTGSKAGSAHCCRITCQDPEDLLTLLPKLERCPTACPVDGKKAPIV